MRCFTSSHVINIAAKGDQAKDEPLNRIAQMGAVGEINFRLGAKTGDVVAAREVVDDDELMLVTRNGVVNRQRADEIRVIGRNTQGVRVIALDDGDELIDMARVARDIDDDEEDAAEASEGAEEAEDTEEELEAAGSGDGAED